MKPRPPSTPKTTWPSPIRTGHQCKLKVSFFVPMMSRVEVGEPYSSTLIWVNRKMWIDSESRRDL
jgi:hypothetical protein